MTDLEVLAKKFGCSEPIFKLTTVGKGSIEFSVKHKYDPFKFDDRQDPVVSLLAQFYREQLNPDRTGFEAIINIESALYHMVVEIRDFYLQNSPLKNPKQTKLWKWLGSEFEYKDNSSPVFIALWRYMVNNRLNESRDNNDPYVKNVLAILELMKEKYSL